MPSTDSPRVYIVGIHATPVGRYEQRSFTDLAREALAGVLKDAGSVDPERIEATWFANSLLDYYDQRGMRGQAVLGPLIEEGLLPNGHRITNVEGACASGSVAFNGAWSAIRQGADLAAAVGVEKMNAPARPDADILEWIQGSGGALDPGWFWGPHRRLAAELGVEFELGAGRSMAMDAYALLARWHMHAYGTTVEQIAFAAAKNHNAAVDNPRAQYRFPMSEAEVLADRVVAAPLTRAMCAPRGDAAAAALLCSERHLAGLPAEVRRHAVLVRGHAIAGGHIGAGWEDDRSTVRAARDAYRMAGLGPSDLDVVEVHDATSFAEVHVVEDLGLCPRGQGGRFTASGATELAGRIPVNPSGGLVARGHPLGATGIVMLNELALQLRGEAEAIQVAGARIGLAENAGGFLGLDNALCSITILEAL